MTRQTMVAGALLLTATFGAAPAMACTADPFGDFEASYTGPGLAALDITCVSVSFDGTAFHMKAMLADSIANAGSSYLVWGIDRGKGAPRLQFQGAPPPIKPDLLFDAVFLAYQDGSSELGIIPEMGPPDFTFPDGLLSYAGNVMTATIPLAMLPSSGFDPWNYRFTVWSHYQANPDEHDNNNVFKADFSATIRPAIPEPASWAMMIFGFGAVGRALRASRRKMLPA